MFILIFSRRFPVVVRSFINFTDDKSLFTRNGICQNIGKLPLLNYRKVVRLNWKDVCLNQKYWLVPNPFYELANLLHSRPVEREGETSSSSSSEKLSTHGYSIHIQCKYKMYTILVSSERFRGFKCIWLWLSCCSDLDWGVLAACCHIGSVWSPVNGTQSRYEGWKVSL